MEEIARCLFHHRSIIFSKLRLPLYLHHFTKRSSQASLQFGTMAAPEPVPLEAQPYEWNDAEPPPPAETLNLWNEVGNGIDKSQTGEQH